MIKKALAGKKFATGGVVNGQAGYKDGGKVNSKGIIPESMSAKGAEGFKNTKMHTAKPDRSPAKTGGVKLGNGGGYAMGGTIKGATDWENRPANTAKAGKTGGTTGGVRKGNAGGYKEGGATKKAYATGGTVDTGKPVAMPKKPVSKPIANSLQSGTFAKGGKVEKEEKPNLRLLKTHTGPKGDVAKVYKDKDWGEHRVKFYSPDGKHRSDSDYHTDDLSDAHDTAKSQLNRYKAGGNAKRYNAGGTTVDASKGAYDKSIGPSEEEMDMAKAIRSVPRKLYEGAKSMLNIGSSTPKPAGSVTKTEKSVTVTPANKKRGGRC
jgi:NAD(P)H-dependent FMN reductase